MWTTPLEKGLQCCNCIVSSIAFDAGECYSGSSVAVAFYVGSGIALAVALMESLDGDGKCMH